MDDGWRSEALCATDTFKQLAKLAGANRDPSQVFFPVTETDDGKEVKRNKPAHQTYLKRQARFEALAKVTCENCPVQIECLLWTMEIENEPYGYAGGKTADERSALLEGL